MGDRIGVVDKGAAGAGRHAATRSTTRRRTPSSPRSSARRRSTCSTCRSTSARGRAHNGALAFALDAATRDRLAPLLPADGKVRLGIRPENIRFVDADDDADLAGSIYGAENHGAEIIAVVEAGGHKLRATVPAKTPTALNQAVRVALMQDKLHFFHPKTGETLRSA